jgi:hypothetical protein
MATKGSIKNLLAVLAVGGLTFGLAHVVTAAPPTMASSIDGTYKFVERDLPDGTKVHPPDAVGLMILTHGNRSFNIYWHDANGKKMSISCIATYKFTPTEYTETNVYYMTNDEASDEPISYDLTESTKSSPVTMKDGRISFQMPNHGEPAVVFDGKGFTATRAGAFVDHWVKIGR